MSNQLPNSTNVQQFEYLRKWLVKNQKSSNEIEKNNTSKQLCKESV